VLRVNFGTGYSQVARGSLLPGAITIDTTGATAGQVLAYDASTGKFKPAANAKLHSSGQLALGDAVAFADQLHPYLVFGTGGGIAYYNNGSPMLAYDYDAANNRFEFGDSNKSTLYRGGAQVAHTSKNANFTTTIGVSRYDLTGDNLTITVDNSLADDTTFEFWSSTQSASPGHTFTMSAGQIGGAGVPLASTYPWPSGATRLKITKIATNKWLVG
jgi:hypothetical protein